MSMTVRYPTGLAVTYPDAAFLTHGDGMWTLSTADPANGGKKIAFIQQSAGVMVEFSPKCRAEFSALNLEKAAQILSSDATELKKQPFRVLRNLKRTLAHFNAKTGGWH